MSFLLRYLCLNIMLNFLNSLKIQCAFYVTGCNKSSQLPFRVKKDVPAVKIKDEPQFLLGKFYLIYLQFI